jgi:hypothetical protein
VVPTTLFPFSAPARSPHCQSRPCAPKNPDEIKTIDMFLGKTNYNFQKISDKNKINKGLKNFRVNQKQKGFEQKFNENL